MSASPSMKNLARCTCGKVVLEVSGDPIICAACYCDDCQAGARRIEALPGAVSVLDPEGGSEYVLYRKDRMECTVGTEYLRDDRLKPSSPTRRVVATCCNAAMFLDFEKAHWYSMYRGRFGDAAPPLEMRVQMKFTPQESSKPDDVPRFRGHSWKFLWRVVRARLTILIGR